MRQRYLDRPAWGLTVEGCPGRGRHCGGLRGALGEVLVINAAVVDAGDGPGPLKGQPLLTSDQPNPALGGEGRLDPRHRRFLPAVGEGAPLEQEAGEVVPRT